MITPALTLTLTLTLTLALTLTLSRTRCKQNYGGASHPCPAEYPECVGFVEGQGWGQCWSTCNATGHPNLWGEVRARIKNDG